MFLAFFHRKECFLTLLEKLILGMHMWTITCNNIYYSHFGGKKSLEIPNLSTSLYGIKSEYWKKVKWCVSKVTWRVSSCTVTRTKLLHLYSENHWNIKDLTYISLQSREIEWKNYDFNRSNCSPSTLYKGTVDYKSFLCILLFCCEWAIEWFEYAITHTHAHRETRRGKQEWQRVEERWKCVIHKQVSPPPWIIRIRLYPPSFSFFLFFQSLMCLPNMVISYTFHFCWDILYIMYNVVLVSRGKWIRKRIFFSVCSL